MSVFLDIPDSEGVEHPYQIDADDLGGAVWAVQAVRLDAKRLGEYRVWLDESGWRCSCPSQSKPYGLARRGRHSCKHITSVAPLAALGGIDVAAKEKPAPVLEPEVVEQPKVPGVYAAIMRVIILLDGMDGTDTIHDAMQGLLVDAGLLILPESIWESESNPALIVVEYRFVCVADGSSHVISVIAESMGIAYRRALSQAFCLLDEGPRTSSPAKVEQGVPATVPEPKPAPKPPGGAAFVEGLHAYEAALARKGLCKAGDLVKHIAQHGKREGFDPDMSSWTEAEITSARAETKEFEARAKLEVRMKKEGTA